MAQYYLFIIVVLLLAFLSNLNNARYGSINSKINLFDFLILLVWVVFSAIRFQVGTDYLQYYLNYISITPDQILYQLENSSQEFGFTLLSVILKNLSDWPFLIFWVASVLTYFPVLKTIKRESVDPSFSYALYILLALYVFPFNMIRQGISVSLNFLSISFIKKNKRAFFLINAIASTFHISALIAALIQLSVYKVKVSKLKATIMISISVAISLVLSRMSFLIELLDSINSRYGAYLQYGHAGIGTYLIIFVQSIIVIYSLVLKRGENKDDMFIFFGIISLCLMIISTASIPFSRMAWYFNIYFILLIPQQTSKLKKPVVHKTIIFILGLVYFYFYITSYSNLIPYQTYLDYR